MHSLKDISASEILLKTKQTALEERRLGIELLRYLQEIERRKLFAPKFSSLHEYVVRELGYSDGAAHRRISAMRLMRDIPEVEQKLSHGTLTLSSASQVQNFLITEKRSSGNVYSPLQKQELISSVENKSTRETEALLAARSPRTAALIRERPRSIDGQNVQVTVILSARLQAKLRQLKNLMAHQHPNPSLSEQLEMLADLALRRLDPAAKPARKAVETRDPPEAVRDANSKTKDAAIGQDSSGQDSTARASTDQPSTEGVQLTHFGAEAAKRSEARRSRFIPRATRQAVWTRAGSQCEFRSTESGIRCPRRHLLQIDHRTPFSRGGGNRFSNLQLLCATHNQWKGARPVNPLTASGDLAPTRAIRPSTPIASGELDELRRRSSR
jgi:hypothetical protein